VPSPSSNRTCGFPASGSRVRRLSLAFQVFLLFCFSTQLLSKSSEFWRQMGFQNLYRFIELKIFCRLFCHRISQSARYFSDSACLTLSPLRSTGITPLHHYYGALRLPVMATIQVIDSLSSLLALPNTMMGLPGSGLICRCALPSTTPSSPTGAFDRCFPVDIRLHHLWKDSHPPEEDNEAESGSLALRLTTLLSVGFNRLRPRLLDENRPAYSIRLPFRSRSQLHVERSINTADTLQSARSARLCLAHQRRGERGGKDCLINPSADGLIKLDTSNVAQ